MATTREFFLTEARDCLTRLNALHRASNATLVDAAELHRVSRALRGSAQMARETRVQAVAHALETASRALVQGGLAWDLDVRGVLERTLEDLAVLIETDGADPALDERAAAALERWERQGLELPALPEPAPPPPPAAPEADPLSGAGALAAQPTAEDLPVEVVNFFRAEAGALLDRIERMTGERPQGAADRPGAARELKDTITALRDLANTFGFSQSAAAAERLLEGIERGGPPVALLMGLRRLVTSEVPGQAGEPAAADPAAFGPAAPPEPAAAPAAARGAGPGAQAEDDVVPIETLLYRGEAALRRALELRPALERAVGDDPAGRDAVDELFDLIRLGLP